MLPTTMAAAGTLTSTVAATPTMTPEAAAKTAVKPWRLLPGGCCLAVAGVVAEDNLESASDAHGNSERGDDVCETEVELQGRRLAGCLSRQVILGLLIAFEGGELSQPLVTTLVANPVQGTL